MASFNKVLLIGNLTRDPETRVTPKGTAICQFGLAVNRQFKDESGQLRDDTTFVDVEAWGKQAETVAKYCVKGRALFIDGRLKLDQWEDKTTGAKRSKIKVVLETFQFLGSPRDEAQRQIDQGATNTPAAPAPRPSENLDEDVPF